MANDKEEPVEQVAYMSCRLLDGVYTPSVDDIVEYLDSDKELAGVMVVLICHGCRETERFDLRLKLKTKKAKDEESDKVDVK